MPRTYGVLQGASLEILLVRAPLGIVPGLAVEINRQVLVGIREQGGGKGELIKFHKERAS